MTICRCCGEEQAQVWDLQGFLLQTEGVAFLTCAGGCLTLFGRGTKVYRDALEADGDITVYPSVGHTFLK